MATCICGRKTEDNSTRCSRCVALYEIGLENGATETDIQEAFLAHLKAWHPDRFAGDRTQQRVAELKLRKVNAAYLLLNSPTPIPKAAPPSPHYWQPAPPQPAAKRLQGAELPAGPVANSYTAAAAPPPPTPDSDRYPDWIPAIPETSEEDELAHLSPSAASRGLRTPAIYILLFVAVLAGTYFLNRLQSKPPAFHQAGSSAPPIPAVIGGAVATTQQSQAPQPVPDSFTLGSSKSEVLAIQGQPTAQDDNILHYGLSTVSFQNDQVVGWTIFPVNPLKVILKPHSQPDSNSGNFGIGSSKDEVITIQGTPTAIAGNTYFYGKSSVTFEDGKVTTWSRNPANPLHVR